MSCFWTFFKSPELSYYQSIWNSKWDTYSPSVSFKQRQKIWCNEERKIKFIKMKHLSCYFYNSLWASFIYNKSYSCESEWNKRCFTFIKKFEEFFFFFHSYERRIGVSFSFSSIYWSILYWTFYSIKIVFQEGGLLLNTKLRRITSIKKE